MPEHINAANSSVATSYAEVFGSPGTRVRMTGLLRTQWPILVVFILCGYLLRAALPWPPISSTIAGILFLALAVCVAAAANYSRRNLQAFLKGARGEELVARQLALLPVEYAVFHGIATRSSLNSKGGSDLDHVVVGPTGVFVIETKNWTGDIEIKHGELIYEGISPSRPPIDQVKTAATQLHKRLAHLLPDESAVNPILCFASNCLPSDQQGSSGVRICNATALTSIITESGSNTLNVETCKRIKDALQIDCER